MIFKMTRIHRVEEIIVGRRLDAKVRRRLIEEGMTDHGSFDLFKAIAHDKRKAVARLPIYTEAASNTPHRLISSYRTARYH